METRKSRAEKAPVLKTSGHAVSLKDPEQGAEHLADAIVFTVRELDTCDRPVPVMITHD